jgi:PAT family beta-lactamase induction signal transducer AmpG
MPVTRKLPPVWLLGFTNATFGMYAGFSVVTLPLMLAHLGLPGGKIAELTAAVSSPGFWIFLVAPILDVRFSRRSYALIFAVLAACAMGLAVAHRQNALFLEVTLFGGYVAASLVQGSVGGWIGSLIPRDQDSRLGAWFTVSNIGSGGLMIIVAGECMTRLQPALAGAILGSLLLLPSLLYLVIPAPAPDRRLAKESFSRFLHELFNLLKKREILIAVALFALPSASFTLTNVLGGIGYDFSASERTVSLLAGSGATIAGVVGSLLLPPLGRRFALRPLYLGIGVAGALFTLCLLLLPRTPVTFAVAITGENVFQALAFACSSAIAFETIGRNNPLAATIFSFLIAATNFPVIYMGFVDGRAYSWHGVIGSFLVDAGLSVFFCILLGVGLWLLHRRERSAQGFSL